MSDLPSVEVLESRHQFPCRFTFKIIGSATDNFVARTLAAVRTELELQADPPCSIRQTAKGRHVSITLEPDCETAEQVRAVYRRVLTLEGLVMLL